MSTPSRRFLVLGLDGGTFELLDPLIAAGELPFLAGLSRRGLSATLNSVYPPKTIPAWYSFATGLDPGSLGIFGFTEPDGGPGRSRLVQTFRPHPAIWDLLSRRGRRVGVLNFPIRAPYPVNGIFVAGMFSDLPQTFPAEAAESITAELKDDYLPELPPYRKSERRAWMKLARRGVEQRAEVAEGMIRKYTPEFLFVLFRETDRIEHQLWSELERPAERIPADLRAFWREVDRSCARIDAAFRAQGAGAITLVISDHGHGAAGTDFFTNRWLVEQGYLKFKDGAGKHRRRFVSRALMGLDRFPPTRVLLKPIIEKLQNGRRGEQLAQFVAGDASFEAMSDRIDWDRTVAYSYPVPEAIYLNPYNSTLTPPKREAITRAIRAGLEAYPEARIEVYDPRELYTSIQGVQPPALMLKVNRMESESRMDFNYPRTMMRQRPAYFYGTGVHRMEGILIAGGDGVPAAGRLDGPLSLLDIAPTILEGMNVAVPAGLAGRSFLPFLGMQGAAR